MHDTNDRPAVMTRTMELVVAAIIFALGAIVIYDSIRLGYGWADDGPESGYVPFYIGVILCLTSAAIFITGLRNKAAASKSFVSVEALKLVLKVLVPTIVYVTLIDPLGIYVASFIFIAFFMWWIGKYSILKIVPVSIGVPVVFFLLFETWFKLPLPKGPLEAALGLN